MADSLIKRINPIFMTVVAVIVMLALWQIRAVLMLAFAAAIIAILCSMPVRFLQNRFNLNRVLSIFASVILFIVVIAVLVLLIFPALIVEFGKIANDLPQGIETLISDLGNSWQQLQESVPFLQDLIFESTGEQLNADFVNQLVQQVTSALGQLGGSVLPFVNDVANGFLSMLIVLFLSIYLLSEPSRYADIVVRLAPIWYRQRLREIFSRCDLTIRSWLVVTGISMIVAGVFTGLALAVLGVQQWASLGILTGILSFVPNFGTLVALVIVLAVAIGQQGISLGLVILAVLIVSFLQSQLVSPLLARESMKLPPAFILLGQIIAGVFFGFMGLLLAVPITALVLLLIEEVYVKDILGDRVVTEDQVLVSSEHVEPSEPPKDETILTDGI